MSRTLTDPKPIAHVERNFTSAGGAHYLLPSDEAERQRLALQHQVLKKAFGGQLVLPPISFARGGNVLDSGTGSASWILDVAEILPPVVALHGIDIEPRLFPAYDTALLGNLQFSVQSITDLPKDWENTFTLVNQRLFIAALPRTGWSAASREIYRVLAPGGWVQLGELASWKAGPVTDRHVAMMNALFDHKDLLLDCAARIPALLEESGFIDIHIETRTISAGKWAGQDGIDCRDDFIGAFRGMKTPILKAGGLGFVNSEAEFDTLLDDMEKEWDETPSAAINFVYIYGQKAQGVSAS